MTPSRLILSTLLIVAVAGVSACGRRAPLERPSDARYEEQREAARKAGQPAPAKPSQETPERPFILDGLID
jgi:predicted small lipoprotein YifL